MSRGAQAPAAPSPGATRDYRTAMRTDMRPKGILAACLPRQSVLGGGGRYNISPAHGDSERDLFLAAIETVLDGSGMTGAAG